VRIKFLWRDALIVTDAQALAQIMGRGDGALDKAAGIYATINYMCALRAVGRGGRVGGWTRAMLLATQKQEAAAAAREQDEAVNPCHHRSSLTRAPSSNHTATAAC